MRPTERDAGRRVLPRNGAIEAWGFHSTVTPSAVKRVSLQWCEDAWRRRSGGVKKYPQPVIYRNARLFVQVHPAGVIFTGLRRLRPHRYSLTWGSMPPVCHRYGTATCWYRFGSFAQPIGHGRDLGDQSGQLLEGRPSPRETVVGNLDPNL